MLTDPHLLPRYYQNRTTQPHVDPCQEHPRLLFLVGLDCLRLEFVKFVNRRSLVRFQSPAPGREATWSLTKSLGSKGVASFTRDAYCRVLGNQSKYFS